MLIPTRRSAFGMLAATLFSGMALGAAQAQISVNINERVMPALKVEVVPPAPHPGWNWVPGHWVWHGRWVWNRGHYVNHEVVAMPAAIVETPGPAPGPHQFWVRGHYAWEGMGWVWHPGHWVR